MVRLISRHSELLQADSIHFRREIIRPAHAIRMTMPADHLYHQLATGSEVTVSHANTGIAVHIAQPADSVAIIVTLPADTVTIDEKIPVQTVTIQPYNRLSIRQILQKGVPLWILAAAAAALIILKKIWAK
jgi:hypothetical protein